MKLIVKFLMVFMIVLNGCSSTPPEEKANVHLYSFEATSVKVVVSKENYNEIIRLEITQNETAKVNDEKMTEQLEVNRQAIEDFVRSAGNYQLVFMDHDPEDWKSTYFLNVRLSEEVKTTDNDLNVYIVKYILDFTNENAVTQCCEYDLVIDHFGLNNAIADGKLWYDLLLKTEDFLFYDVLHAENGLYVPQLEE